MSRLIAWLFRDRRPKQVKREILRRRAQLRRGVIKG